MTIILGGGGQIVDAGECLAGRRVINSGPNLAHGLRVAFERGGRILLDSNSYSMPNLELVSPSSDFSVEFESEFRGGTVLKPAIDGTPALRLKGLRYFALRGVLLEGGSVQLTDIDHVTLRDVTTRKCASSAILLNYGPSKSLRTLTIENLHSSGDLHTLEAIVDPDGRVHPHFRNVVSEAAQAEPFLLPSSWSTDGLHVYKGDRK